MVSHSSKRKGDDAGAGENEHVTFSDILTASLDNSLAPVKFVALFRQYRDDQYPDLEPDKSKKAPEKNSVSAEVEGDIRHRSQLESLTPYKIHNTEFAIRFPKSPTIPLYACKSLVSLFETVSSAFGVPNEKSVFEMIFIDDKHGIADFEIFRDGDEQFRDMVEYIQRI
ncbi:MAG: hypothetical protein MMC33_008238 [Icmadophila ericetorum]|nr:hypothetical protein [Icmadophila ericetorum]